MSTESLLKDKGILVVDDEPDILQSVEGLLDICQVHKAADYDTAVQCLLSYTYDIVIPDIMGVNGFELLKSSVSLGSPTVMLTSHALTPEALKKSIKLGALYFVPKEKMPELKTYLAGIVLGGSKSSWQIFFDKMGSYLDKRFGPDWKERDGFFEEFEKELKESPEEQS